MKKALKGQTHQSATYFWSKSQRHQYNLDELIHNDLKTIILQVSTNNIVEDTPEDIYNKNISLKTKIEDQIPNSQAVIGCLVRRSDVKANKMEKLNNFIKLAKLKFIDNGNITDKHLGRRGLYSNCIGNIFFVKNLLNAIRS